MRRRHTARLLGITLLAVLIASAARAQAPSPASAPALPANAKTSELLSPERDGAWRAIAKERTTRSLVLYVGEQVASVAFLAWLAFSGASAGLRDRLRNRISGPVAFKIAYLALLLALLLCVSLPFDVSRYALSKYYGVNRQDALAWLGDYLLAFFVNSVLAVSIGLGFYWLLDKRPRTWWRWAAAAVIPFAILAAAATPLYWRLFNTFTPLENREFAGRVLDLAARGGVPSDEVYLMDMSRQTNAANAFVVGIGPTAMVALSDTLLERFTEEETLFVMAHEMGHYVHRHIWTGIALGALGALVGVFLLQRICRLLLSRYHERLQIDDLADVASAPTVLLVVSILAATAQPAACLISRTMETQADRFALELTVPADVSPEAGVSAFERLGRSSLSDPSPNPILKWLFWTHPTTDEREEAVRAWARR